MAVAIRLSRGGAKKRPYYRIVVSDSRAPRDGKYLEQIGTYNPMLPKDDEGRVKIDEDRARHWIGVGAVPSDRVARFLDKAGIVERAARNNPKKGEPGEAATWFERAIAVGDNNYPARRAYLGLGDVRFAQGDYEGTADAFRNAMIGGSATDSISRVAQRGLDRVAGFVSLDTAGTVIR